MDKRLIDKVFSEVTIGDAAVIAVTLVAGKYALDLVSLAIVKTIVPRLKKSDQEKLLKVVEDKKKSDTK